jgi:hypothetical protein
MKTFRHLCTAFVLTLALAISTLAGDMETGKAAPQSPGTSLTAMPGQMTTGYAGDMSTIGSRGSTVSATGLVLSLVQSVLALI